MSMANASKSTCKTLVMEASGKFDNFAEIVYAVYLVPWARLSRARVGLRPPLESGFNERFLWGFGIEDCSRCSKGRCF